jgi:hypothetical protein
MYHLRNLVVILHLSILIFQHHHQVVNLFSPQVNFLPNNLYQIHPAFHLTRQLAFLLDSQISILLRPQA